MEMSSTHQFLSSHLSDLAVRPISVNEKPRWKALMEEHHYLGFAGVAGNSIFYVATLEEQWVALICWSTAALHVGVREQWLGWDRAVRKKRLKFIANNSRFLILPGVKIKNLASKVLSLNLARLSRDWQAFHGSSIWLAESFVDPSRYRGTCYLAANWQMIGLTRGFSRVPAAEGFYRQNNQPKMYLAYPLIKKFKEKFSDPHFEDKRRGDFFIVDIRKLPMDGKHGLIQTLKTVNDPRRRQGRMHTSTSVLAMSTCAMLSGARSFRAIAEWGSRLKPQELQRLRCRQKRAPSESTIQRVLRRTNAQEFDDKISSWLMNAAGGSTSSKGIAIDGKVLRGSYGADGKQIQLLSALLHEEKIVISQRQIETKNNEITEFNNLLENIDIEGLLVTADALHCQKSHADFLVNKKKAKSL